MTKTKHYLAPTDAIAAGLADGSLREIVIPMDPQPKRPLLQTASGSWRYLDGEGVDPKSPIWRPPYQMGDLIAVKEAWGISYNDHEHPCLCYRADGEDYGETQMMLLWDHKHRRRVQVQTDCPSWEPDKWESAESIPDCAVRTYLLCEATDCREIDGGWRWVCQISIFCSGIPERYILRT